MTNKIKAFSLSLVLCSSLLSASVIRIANAAPLINTNTSTLPPNSVVGPAW